jgi:hypothetical protein
MMFGAARKSSSVMFSVWCFALIMMKPPPIDMSGVPHARREPSL